jgi:hypothetical protein
VFDTTASLSRRASVRAPAPRRPASSQRFTARHGPASHASCCRGGAPAWSARGRVRSRWAAPPEARPDSASSQRFARISARPARNHNRRRGGGRPPRASSDDQHTARVEIRLQPTRPCPLQPVPSL